MALTPHQREPLTREELLAIPGEEIADWTRLPAEPLVSVLMITWNHEAWIAEAIAGVVAQRCPFPIELLIGEDCSPDRTLALCREAQARHPHLIRVIHAARNVGAKRNNLRLRARARGRYLALCEGDDYWIDPDKLAKQVAVLEADPGLSGCFTTVETHQYEPGTSTVVRRWPRPWPFRPRWTYDDLVATGDQPHTSSLVYRRDAVALPRWFIEVPVAHRSQLLLHACVGPLAALPEITAVYRFHGFGLSSSGNRLRSLSHRLAWLRRLAQHLGRPRADRLAGDLVATMFDLIGEIGSRHPGWRNGRRLLHRILPWMTRIRPRPWRMLVTALIGLHAPGVHRLGHGNAWADVRRSVPAPLRRMLRRLQS